MTPKDAIETVSVLFSLAMLIFMIVFFITWYRNRRALRPFRSFAFAVSAVYILMEIVALIMALKYYAFYAFVTETITFFRLSAYTIVGIYYCTLMDMPSFPLLIKKMDLKLVLDDIDTDEAPIATVEERSSIAPVVAAYKPGTMLASTAIVAAAGIVYSLALFWLTGPSMSSLIETNLGSGYTSFHLSPVEVIIVLAIALSEELTFRLGIQNLIAKHLRLRGNKYWWAIALTAALWSMGHVGVMDPNWVKMAQIFPFGLALGWLFKKYGAESSIIAHGLFNVILIIPSVYLISH